jgi:hypothetical protein
MAFVAVALGAGSLLSGILGSNAASSAASDQANAAQHAADIGYNEFQTITQQQQPFMQSGYGALNSLDYLLGIQSQGQPQGSYGTPYGSVVGQGGAQGTQGQNPASLLDPLQAMRYGVNQTGGGGTTPMTQQPGYMPGPNQQGQGQQPQQQSNPAGGYGSLVQPFTADTFHQYSPAYQFQLQQGQQGVLSGDASSRGALSGSAYKDLMDYNQNLANTSFNNAFNQYQTQQNNTYNRLFQLANLGQNAAANTGQQGTALTGQIGQALTNIGTAQAGGAVGSGPGGMPSQGGDTWSEIHV